MPYTRDIKDYITVYRSFNVQVPKVQLLRNYAMENSIRAFNCVWWYEKTSEYRGLARAPVLPCKAKRQYLLTLQVSKYCLYAAPMHVSELGGIQCVFTWVIIDFVYTALAL